MINLPNRRDVPAVTPTRTPEVAEFLDKLRAERPANAGHPSGAGRLIFALDSTASREPTWDVACGLTHQMFASVTSLGGLMTQLAFYRGMSECKASGWVTRDEDLHRLMRQVRCDAGITQIARILDHAIRETGTHPVNALIFIGDAMEEPLDGLAHQAGRLGALNTPIFLFHEGHDPSAASAFRQFARMSHGVYLPFDLSSLDRLRELLGAVAVYASGGLAALEKHAVGKPEVLRITTQLKR